MGKLTTLEVENAKAGAAPYKLSDGEGLQLRIATDGAKTWLVRHVVDGKTKQYTLPNPYRPGSLEHVSLADARKEAQRIRQGAKSEGIDEHARRERERRVREADRLLAEATIAAGIAQSNKDKDDAERAMRKAQEDDAARLAHERTQNLTVQNLYEAWIADGVQRKDGNATLVRYFNAYILPAIGSKPIKLVTEQDIAKLLRALSDRGVKRTAVLARNSLRQMFRWAEMRQPWRKLLVDGNPVALVNIDLIVGAGYDNSNVCDRVLSASEIRELHNIFNTMQADYEAADNRRSFVQPVVQPVQRAIWIMLSTLCRVGELLMARWEHVNLETGEWFIPRQNVKGESDDLAVYLSAFALNQFRQLHDVTGESEWCFPAKNKLDAKSIKNENRHVCVKSVSKQVGDRQTIFKKSKDGGPRQQMKNRAKGANALVLGDGKTGAWTPHDLRRTGATLMQGLGVPLDIIDYCMNHVVHGSKVRKHYLHHKYNDEKREAWRLLGSRLDLIIGAADNVVPLVRTA